MAMPVAPAPKMAMAALLSKRSNGLSGAASKPSGPAAVADDAAYSMSSARTSQTSATPRIFAVSSMWKNASDVIIARPIAM